MSEHKHVCMDIIQVSKRAEKGLDKALALGSGFGTYG